MLYPILDESSLKNRCDADIKIFVKNILNNKSNSINDVLYDLYPNQGEVVSYNTMKNYIRDKLEKFNKVLNKKINNNNNNNNNNKQQQSEDFNYAHDILKFNPQEQNELWIMRTLLCYQMMIFGTILMKDKSLYDEVYLINGISRTFRDDVISELPSFKLGIFGSITPTSDIDIGIQYSGHTRNFTGLDYVVATMEDMFIHFLGIESTLILDIEYYADMMTIHNTNDNEHPDLFYLDTVNFTEKHFNEMLPYAYASIYRNYVTAKKDGSDKNATDVINNPSNITELSGMIKENAPAIVIDDSKMEIAIKLVREYMSLPYTKAREKYYTHVKSAEEEVAKIRYMIQNKQYDALTPDIIENIMSKIALSLIFRAESYVCAPTVMHVVRLLQADPSKLKYPVIYPKECITKPEYRLINPQCGIGMYGYELSRLEQIGYIIRFKITYCNTQNKQEQCNKKITKYGNRLKNATERMESLDKNKMKEPVGGYRKKRVNKRGSRATKRRATKRRATKRHATKRRST